MLSAPSILRLAAPFGALLLALAGCAQLLSPEAAYDQGIEAYEAAEYEKALALLDRAAAGAPDDPLAIWWRGECHYALDDPEQAFADFERAAELARADDAWLQDGTLIAIYAARGDYRYTAEQYEQAIADYDAAIALADQGNPLPAEWTASQILSSRADAHFYQDAFAVAYADYERSAETPDYDYETLNNAAWTTTVYPEFRELRDLDKALTWSRRACEATGWQMADCLDTHAAVLAARGDFAEARKWQQQAVRACDDAWYLGHLRQRLALYHAEQPYVCEEDEDQAPWE